MVLQLFAGACSDGAREKKKAGGADEQGISKDNSEQSVPKAEEPKNNTSVGTSDRIQEDLAKSTDDSDDFLQLLTGGWWKKGCGTSVHGFSTAVSVKISNIGFFQSKTVGYNGTNCSDPTYKFVAKGKVNIFDVSGETAQVGWLVSHAELEVYNPTVMNIFNTNSLCGRSDFKLNEKAVLEVKNCKGKFKEIQGSMGTIEFLGDNEFLETTFPQEDGQSSVVQSYQR